MQKDFVDIGGGGGGAHISKNISVSYMFNGENIFSTQIFKKGLHQPKKKWDNSRTRPAIV